MHYPLLFHESVLRWIEPDLLVDDVVDTVAWTPRKLPVAWTKRLYSEDLVNPEFDVWSRAAFPNFNWVLVSSIRLPAITEYTGRDNGTGLVGEQNKLRLWTFAGKIPQIQNPRLPVLLNIRMRNMVVMAILFSDESTRDNLVGPSQ
jgi:hypothetical protein